MQKNSYRSILYFITVVILVTLGIQVYWNFKNYEASKQQLINEAQISLDNAIDQYYEDLAKNKTIRFVSEFGDLPSALNSINFGDFLKKIDSGKAHLSNFKFEESNITENIEIFRGNAVDSANSYFKTLKINDSIHKVIGIKDSDSIKISIDRTPFETLTSKIMISIAQDNIELQKIDSLLTNELSRKNLDIDYELQFEECTIQKDCKVYRHDSLSLTPKESNRSLIKDSSLSTVSKSSYLPPDGQLQMFFTNTTRTILKKNLIGILLSFLLVGAVIGCLLYLLKIINHQKQLAEVKNDLISNITHEFKTPIATISAALEGIQNFNADNDPVKTQKYVTMSSTQLGKLNAMVEKILETATLDNDELQLNLEEINLVELIETIINKHKANSPDKNISFESSHENIWKKIDGFHFENAINNIIDNAIKYGGNNITVNIKNTDPHIIIEIKDNGASLTKANKEKIFEKFYRVPKGNTHDIKGFGIGLFYTKTIIEKHNGTIRLILDTNLTNFKITLPNG